MKELDFDDADEFQIEKDDSDTVAPPVNNRWRVTVEFVVKADCVDDAEQDVKDIIDYGIIGMMDNEEREPIRSFDVTDSDPDEL